MDRYNEYCFCRGQMGADEYVLWSGRPEKKGSFLSSSDKGSLVFSIIWLVLSLGFGYMGLMAMNDEWFMMIVPFFFPAVGIGLVASHFVKIHRLKNNTEYVITNKKIYRRSGKKVDTFSASVTTNYQTEYHKCGTATIRFPMAIDPRLARVRSNGREIPQYFALVNIGEVERVQQALANMSTES